jgi:hypothetical protein
MRLDLITLGEVSAWVLAPLNPGVTRMHVSGGETTYNHLHFLLLCIHIYVNINRFL